MILILSTAIAGCGLFGGLFGGDDGSKVEAGPEDVVFDTREGPNTKRLVKDMDKGLVSDQSNARHSNEALRGDDDVDDEDGSGGL